MNTQEMLAVFALKDYQKELHASGACDPEAVDDLFEKVKERVKGAAFLQEESYLAYDKAILLKGWLDLLSQGKNLKVEGLSYVYRKAPTIKLTGENGVEDHFELSCVSDETFERYLPEKYIDNLTEVAVVGYEAGETVPIEYIYANPQMNKLFAHLSNGHNVDYSLSILDINHIVGEFTGLPSVPEDASLVMPWKELRDIILQGNFSEQEKQKLWENIINSVGEIKINK